MRRERYKQEQSVYERSFKANDADKIADGLFDGTVRREQSDSRQRPRPVGCAAECDGLEDPPFARMIGSASHLALRLQHRAGDKLQGQGSSVVVWHASPVKASRRAIRNSGRRDLAAPWRSQAGD